MNLQDQKTEIKRDLRQIIHMNINADICGRAESLIKDIERDVYTIVVLGEFKRGKSTFINALLGEALLPMNVLPETATINMVHYGEEPNLQVYYHDGHVEQGEVSYEYLKQFSAESDHDRANDIKYIDLSYPLNMLQENVILVDTPGVSDLNEQRSAVTYGITPKANAVIFLLDAASPLKETERSFIENKLLDIGIDNIIFIANRYDFVDEEEDPDFLSDLSIRLKNAFMKDGKEEIKNIELLPLSASMALQGEETNNQAMILASGINEVREKIQSMLHDGIIEQQKVFAYKNRARNLFQRAYKEVQNKIVLQNTDIDALKEAQKNLNSVLDDSINNKKSVAAYIEETKPIMYAMVDKSIYYFNNKLQEDVRESVNVYQGTGFKEYIEHSVSRNVKNNFESWISSYTPYIEQLLKKMEIELSNGLSYFFRQNIRVESQVVSEMKSSGYQIAVEAEDISGVNFKAGAIAAVGGMGLMAIFGGAFMPFIGFAALPFLREKMLKESLENAKSEIMPQLMSEIGHDTLKLQNEVHKYIDERCDIIRQNTEYAYDQILLHVKEDISSQINEREQHKEDIVSDIEDLKKVEINMLMGK